MARGRVNRTHGARRALSEFHLYRCGFVNIYIPIYKYKYIHPAHWHGVGPFFPPRCLPAVSIHIIKLFRDDICVNNIPRKGMTFIDTFIFRINLDYYFYCPAKSNTRSLYLRRSIHCKRHWICHFNV